MVRIHRSSLVLATLLLASLVLTGCWSSRQVTSNGFVPPPASDTTTSTPHATGGTKPTPKTVGNILIADRLNNRVIELSKDGKIVWSFGTGGASPGPDAIVGPTDAERIPGAQTLICAAGVSAGTTGYPENGVVDSRVVIVDSAGRITWQYGKLGVVGSGSSQLNMPAQATYLHAGGTILITDRGNDRVILVNRAKQILWQYGKTGVRGHGANRLNRPSSAILLKSGNLMITDTGNNRVIEVTSRKKVVWSYGSRKATRTLHSPMFASRPDDGNTLISDSLNNRIVEVSKGRRVVWNYATDSRAGSVKLPAPTHAVRLKDGGTLISDQFNDQVIVVSKEKKVVWSYGSIGVAGHAAGQLNAPYDAKAVGDDTGLSRP